MTVVHSSRLGLTILLACIGCGQSQSPDIARFRDQLLAAEEPQGAISIQQARSEVAAGKDIVLVGHIGASDLPEWSVGEQASFVITEAMADAEHAASPDHDPATCPFCRRKLKPENTMAWIECRQPSGESIPVPASRLLPLQRGDQVVLRGQGAVDEDGFLHVQATQIYIRSNAD